MIFEVTQTNGALFFLLINFVMLPLNAQSLEQSEEEDSEAKALLEKELLRRIKGADIKAWMDPEEDPCNDFYNFVCGNWQRINSAQVMNENVVTKYNKSQKAMEKRFNILLNNLQTGDPIEDKISDFYESCQNIQRNDWKYRSGLKKFYDVFGKFSYSLKNGRRKVTKTFSWWVKLAHLYKMYGRKDFIIDIDQNCDLLNCNQTMIYLGKPQSELSSDDRQQMAMSLQKFFNATAEEAKQVVNDVYDFQAALSEAGITNFPQYGQTLNDIYTLYNTSDLQEKYRDYFDLITMLKISFNTTEDQLQQVYVRNDGYLDRVGEIINKTETAIVDDYILWLQLKDYVVDAETTDMDTFCANVTRKYFGTYIEHAMYEEFRSEEFENETFAVWNDIKEVLLNDLQGNKYHWISRATRNHAISKLNNMKFQINSYDDQRFNDFFKGLRIDSANYVMNLHNILKRQELWRRYKLRMAPNVFRGDEEPISTPTYYLRQNVVKIPTAILQPFHFWHRQYPKAILYGTVGSLLAHEMIHAFDDIGRHYDANGNVNSWWDSNSEDHFEDRRLCFQIQYSNYSYGEFQLVNSTIQKENIADSAGVKIAYMAYNRWLEREQQVHSNVAALEKLQNLPYNHLQLFFISYGQHWCEDVKPEYHSSYANNEVYPPGRNRLTGSLANFHIFSLVFKCAPKTPMNPTERCEMF